MDKLTSPATAKQEEILKPLLQRFERVPTDVNLADELIAERRFGSRREEKPHDPRSAEG